MTPPASILIVDDTPANLHVLAAMLRDRQYRVRPVPGGRLALQAARRQPPDLILLDINMPEMSGYDVCEQLKADAALRDVPVIFISALTEPIDKVRAFAVGGVDYLTKPFQMDELQARVQTHLRLRRQQRDLAAAHDRLRADLDLARQVQRSLLPAALPAVPGYAFFAHYQPAQEVGGDAYDFVPLPGGRLAVVVGDVVGKGVPAALLMAKLTADARACLLTEPDPAAAVTRLNGLTDRAEITDRFVTLLAAVLDPARHTVTLVNAGHPPPLLYRATDRTATEATDSDASGFPLGVMPGHTYTAATLTLAPGDALMAFTDGVTEAMDDAGRQLQPAGLHAAVLGRAYSPQALGERIVDTVARRTAGRPPADDVTVVGFGRVA